MTTLSGMLPGTIVSFIVSAMLSMMSSVVCFSQDAVHDTNSWLIPKQDVLSGGVPKDGIPSLENPALVRAADARYLSDDDLIFGVVVKGEPRAYPLKILDRHEIVNDEIKGVPISILYCPLTGSGMGWNPVINGRKTEFGVSGLLYNSNLIAYDRTTDSFWSQIGLQCVQGELKGQKPETIPLIETTWETWKDMYPDSNVLSDKTGIYPSYDQYSYIISGKDYREDDVIMFPVGTDDKRLHRKDKVHGVIVRDTSKVYRIKKFSRSVETVNDTIESAPIVVVGSSGKNFAMSFERTLADGTILEFSPVKNNLPVAMEDNEGTSWDVFGYAVSGPRKGTRLKLTKSFTSYWFAWGTFYPDAEIYKK